MLVKLIHIIRRQKNIKFCRFCIVFLIYFQQFCMWKEQYSLKSREGFLTWGKTYYLSTERVLSVAAQNFKWTGIAFWKPALSRFDCRFWPSWRVNANMAQVTGLVLLQRIRLETSHTVSTVVLGSLHPDIHKTFPLNFIFQRLLRMKTCFC